MNSILSPKKFLTRSLGCRVNQAEIETITRQLIKRGYALCKAKETPDFILLNTCAVTKKAELETRKEIKRLKKLYPQSFLVVLGCAVTAQEKYHLPLPQSDLLISNENKQRVIDLLEKKFASKALIYSEIPPTKYILSGRKFIKIQEGCDIFCSFCLTACLRGKPTSIPPSFLIEEIKYWQQHGIKEIILTGINISLYGKDLKEKITIKDLIEKILLETKVERISLSSIYPEMLTSDFLKLVISNPRISQFFHLSIQSGSPTVLQRMNRKTDLNKLSQILEEIKTQNPYFTFRGDFLVGFPNESEKEFEETLQFIKENKISFVHVFPFSPREGTVAFEKIQEKVWQDLPAQTKKERVKKLMEVVKEVRTGEAEKQLNRVFSCLIIRKIKGTPNYEGLTENNWPVVIKGNFKEKKIPIKGQIFPVKVTTFENDQLFGEIIDLPR